MEKKKESLAFEQKCAAATEKMTKHHKSYLHEDMQRMLDEAENKYGDIRILLSGTSIMLHSCVIRARCDGLWGWLSEVGQCIEGVTVVSLQTLDQVWSAEETQVVVDSFRALYTEDDVGPALQNLQKLLDQHLTNENQPYLDSANQSVREKFFESNLHLSDENQSCLGVANQNLRESDTRDNELPLIGGGESGRSQTFVLHRGTGFNGDLSRHEAVGGTFRHNFDDNNIHEISENITNTSLDKAKNETRYLNQLSEMVEQSQSDEVGTKCVDCFGSCNIIVQQSCSDLIGGDFETKGFSSNHVEDEEEKLEYVYKQKAHTIVEKAIEEAKRLVTATCNSSGLSNGSCTLNGFDHETVGSESSQSVFQTVTGHEDDELIDTDTKSCASCDSLSNGNKGVMNGEKLSNVVPGCVSDKHELVLRVKDSHAGMQALLETKLGIQRKVTACCKLGEDLLRLLLDETNCDFVIEVNGTRMPVHRCVLSTRSEYFSAMLNSAWKEAGNQMTRVEEAKVTDVRQILLYIYAGCVDVITGVDIHSMAILADMYNFDRLRDVVAFNLTRDYCHFFHKPCKECTKQVPYALACAAGYNMAELRDKCVKWINKHFAQVWNTKDLLTLPWHILDMCLKVAIDDLSVDTVIDTLLTCCQLNEKTSRSIKWIEPMFGMIDELKEAAIKFSSSNFVNLISDTNLRRLDQKSLAFNKQPIEDIFSMIIKTLSPEVACRAYLAVHKWVKTIETVRNDTEGRQHFTKEFESLIDNLFTNCGDQLCANIHLVVNTAEWELLSAEMRDKVKQLAGYIQIGSTKPKMGKPKLSSDNRKKTSEVKGMSLKEYFECHTGHFQIPQPAKEQLNTAQQNIQSHEKSQKAIKSQSARGFKQEESIATKKIQEAHKSNNRSTSKTVNVNKQSKAPSSTKEKVMETKEQETIGNSHESVPVQCNRCHREAAEVAVDIGLTQPFQVPDPIVFEPDILLPTFEVSFTIG